MKAKGNTRAWHWKELWLSAKEQQSPIKETLSYASMPEYDRDNLKEVVASARQWLLHKDTIALITHNDKLKALLQRTRACVLARTMGMLLKASSRVSKTVVTKRR